MICPYDGAEAELIKKEKMYGSHYRFGYMWVCKNYPECDSYVGCHGNSVRPLGHLANHELRWWRRKAHFEFDKLWKREKIDRVEAYKQLSEKMDISRNECHIGMFGIEQCKKVIEICTLWNE